MFSSRLLLLLVAQISLLIRHELLLLRTADLIYGSMNCIQSKGTLSQKLSRTVWYTFSTCAPPNTTSQWGTSIGMTLRKVCIGTNNQLHGHVWAPLPQKAFPGLFGCLLLLPVGNADSTLIVKFSLCSFHSVWCVWISTATCRHHNRHNALLHIAGAKLCTRVYSEDRNLRLHWGWAAAMKSMNVKSSELAVANLPYTPQDYVRQRHLETCQPMSSALS